MAVIKFIFQLVMHLLATYLDSQLLPLPQNPDGRPFSTQHFFKSPEKPPKAKNTLAIHQTSLHPPHYVLVVGEETLDVTKVCNLFPLLTHQKLCILGQSFYGFAYFFRAGIIYSTRFYYFYTL